MKCSVHCPSAGAGAVVAAAAVAVAVAVAVVSVLLWVLVILAVADLVLAGAALTVVLRDRPQMWRPPAAVKTPARVAVEGRTAPLAIEAPKRVVYRITDLDEITERR